MKDQSSLDIKLPLLLLLHHLIFLLLFHFSLLPPILRWEYKLQISLRKLLVLSQTTVGRLWWYQFENIQFEMATTNKRRRLRKSISHQL